MTRQMRRWDRGFELAGFAVGVIAVFFILGPVAALLAAAVSALIAWRRW